MTVFIALSLLSGCLQEVDKTQYDFVDNPTHDFDQDGYLDVEDCDDADPSINLKVMMYQDQDLDGFPNEDISLEACPNQPVDGYLIEPEDDLFDCDDEDALLQHSDVDQDGVSTCQGDCDDYRIDIIEPETYYLDVDGDGFGITPKVLRYV